VNGAGILLLVIGFSCKRQISSPLNLGTSLTDRRFGIPCPVSVLISQDQTDENMRIAFCTVASYQIVI
jgi:hypothetical protein